MQQTAIFWFRQDLRLKDNPALTAAVNAGYDILPIYILDEENCDWPMGGASKTWLHHSLSHLNDKLAGKLRCFTGDALKVLQKLCKEQNVTQIYWNRCYEPWRIKRDTDIKTQLNEQNVSCHSDNGSLLWEPWQILKQDKTPYKVFTPYYKKGCLNHDAPRKPLPIPNKLELASIKSDHAVSIDGLSLLPKLPWGDEIISAWNIGEDHAYERLDAFIEHGLSGYQDGRNYPSKPNISRMSPHLHFGEISPNQMWYAAAESGAPEKDVTCFKSELGWREFSYYLLYHFPELPYKNFQDKFDAFPWEDNHEHLKAWQTGQTGYPLIDAAMRELYQTGYMHNRPRMVVGSFLVKNLLLPWQDGEKWFWDCLFDADLASNSASWQWVAGSGADAAPYFRIFNPITQSEKFDPDGTYIKKYVPELKHVPAKLIHAPWEMSISEQRMHKAIIGKDYPAPIVNVKETRQRALNAYATIKTSQN
ncbi:MAG: deoxyribodipyrimidine photolyase [Alphaproteobacteria bacterium]|nr:deoxyribodipyrimidine photolyase [Alphaproteobacteria bacterium]|tara:strand:+ start:68696 stop:70123 length:1428 start_codon:yes stop_codon:yes gene_type:complete